MAVLQQAFTPNGVCCSIAMIEPRQLLPGNDMGAGRIVIGHSSVVAHDELLEWVK